jgi:3-methyladenine DNA glycosylase AlkC
MVALQYSSDYKTILGNLKNDSSRFVQKSVGNTLNELFREAPAKTREIIAAWEGARSGTRWIIRHGRRNQ